MELTTRFVLIVALNVLALSIPVERDVTALK